MSFGTILCHQNLVVFFSVCSLEIQKSTAILEKKLTEIEVEYWKTDLHAKII